MRRVSAHGMRQLKMRSGSAQREAQARGAHSAKRKAQSAEREARSAKRVRDKYKYISGRAGFCSGRPRRTLSSVSNGATSLGRQGHRASPAAPATQGACTELEPTPRGRGRSQRARRAGSFLVASVPESEDFSERAGIRSFQNAPESEEFSERVRVKVSFGRNAVLTEDLLGDAAAACGHSRLPARAPPN